MVERIVRSLGQKVRRREVTKLAVGGMIVWKPFERSPTARISGSHTCCSAILILIMPSRDVFQPSCCVQSMDRLRPATLSDALVAPKRLTTDGWTVYGAETSRRRRNDAR